MIYGAEGMKDLACELLSVPGNGVLPEEAGKKECIVHIVAGKANLIIGPDEGQQWRYPLGAYDTVWIPAGTLFRLENDGIGNLEISRYTYGA